MALLGDDGRGYELARKLESCGVWRTWLGDSTYTTFIHFLSTPSSWESFMRADDSKSRAQIHLQLRARALLFDKATVSLFLPSNHNSPSSSSVAVSKLNPNYLHLHGDDVYFTLESNSNSNTSKDAGVASNTTSSKNKFKSGYGVGSRFGESEIDNLHQRFRNEELPETWYNQFIEKYRVSRPYRLSFGDQESDKRTPEGMSAYLRLLEKQKRRRVAFKDDQYAGFGNSVLESMSNMHANSVLDGSNLVDDDASFFPETLFTLNSVPDSTLPPVIRALDNRKVEFYGVLDTLPPVMTRSPVMLERLGIRPEYLGMEQGGGLHCGKNGSDGNRKHLGQGQASQISQKVIARMLTNMGFEGATEVPVEVFSQLLSCHICKLGRILKVLADSYRKQCSAIELIKMFLQTGGISDVGVLAELVKDGTRTSVQQPQQPVHGIQSQLQTQHQSSIRLPQQIPRQMHPQMQQMLHPQVAFQKQQLQPQMRRRQPSTPVIEMDKDRPLVQVKLETPSELPMDVNAFSTINTRHPQMQFRQQQPIATMPNFHAQTSNQLRQLTSLQVPQMQTQNMGIVRPPPVKVEGFSELMGGDSSLKHDSEENKLTSPK